MKIDQYIHENKMYINSCSFNSGLSSLDKPSIDIDIRIGHERIKDGILLCDDVNNYDDIRFTFSWNL